MESGKKLIESWDDVRHRFDDLRQQLVDRFVWHDRILERYENGDLRLHFHFGIRGMFFCAEVMAKIREQAHASDLHIEERSGRSHSEVGHAVLVKIYEFMQPPQRFIPSVVR